VVGSFDVVLIVENLRDPDHAMPLYELLATDLRMLTTPSSMRINRGGPKASKRHLEQLPQEIRTRLEKENALDLELYRHAKRVAEERKQEAGSCGSE
jgi:hypothetical protein